MEKNSTRGNKNWNEMKNTARNRVRWKNLVEALCSEMEGWDFMCI
jgi:hypothetical protein